MKVIHLYVVATLLFVLFCSGVSSQTGGDFTITESVVAGGGNASSGGTFSVDSTSGQTIAGYGSSGPGFRVVPGFWNFVLSPTAAGVGISGRVRAADGSGIPNALLTLAANDGSVRTARSTTFGHYRFENVLVGNVYILSVRSKQFTFGQPSVVVLVVDEIAGVDFVADP